MRNDITSLRKRNVEYQRYILTLSEKFKIIKGIKKNAKKAIVF